MSYDRNSDPRRPTGTTPEAAFDQFTHAQLNPPRRQIVARVPPSPPRPEGEHMNYRGVWGEGTLYRRNDVVLGPQEVEVTGFQSYWITYYLWDSVASSATTRPVYERGVQVLSSGWRILNRFFNLLESHNPAGLSPFEGTITLTNSSGKTFKLQFIAGLLYLISDETHPVPQGTNFADPFFNTF